MSRLNLVLYQRLNDLILDNSSNMASYTFGSPIASQKKATTEHIETNEMTINKVDEILKAGPDDKIWGEFYGYTTPKTFGNFLTGQFSDCTIEVGDKSLELSLHRVLLYQSSGYFKTLFSSRFTESSSCKVHLSESHPPSVYAIVRFIYTNQIRHSTNLTFVAKLYKEADYLDVPPIRAHVVQYLYHRMKEDIEEIKAETIASMLKELADGIGNSKGWEVFDDIFDAMICRKEFEDWMGNEEFLGVLDENGVVARYLLGKSMKGMRRKKVRFSFGDDL